MLCLLANKLRTLTKRIADRVSFSFSLTNVEVILDSRDTEQGCACVQLRIK